MKLLSKNREGSKTSRKYDVPKTPYRRMLSSSSVPEERKLALQSAYLKLDPVLLMDQLEQLQDALWKHAGKRPNTPSRQASVELSQQTYAPKKTKSKIQELAVEPASPQVEIKNVQAAPAQQMCRQYRKNSKPPKPHTPHTWRNSKDPFEDVTDYLRLRVLENPKIKIGKLLKDLQHDVPGRYGDDHCRTLARRLKEWRKESVAYWLARPVAQPADNLITETLHGGAANGQKLRKNGQLRKPHPPHTWRNRKDPFEDVSDLRRLRVLENPKLTAGKLLKRLQQDHPRKYSIKLIRTLHRRVKEWRMSSKKAMAK